MLEGKALVAPITMTDARGPLRAGQAKALATMEDVRHPAFPDIPTVQESIDIRWSVAHWRGLVAPRGLPAELTLAFIEGLKQVEMDPGFQREAKENSFTTRWRYGTEFGRYMDEDDVQFGRIIALLGDQAVSTSKLH